VLAKDGLLRWDMRWPSSRLGELTARITRVEGHAHTGVVVGGRAAVRGEVPDPLTNIVAVHYVMSVWMARACT
jgi:hypothetical protein